MKRHSPEDPDEDLPLFSSIDAARDRGHAAADRAATHAEILEPGWKSMALAVVRAYAEVHAGPFLAEDAARSVVIPDDADRRAIGQVIQAAARAGYIKASGAAPASTSNGSYKTTWVSLVCARSA